ncbi:MAG: 4-aminobutyrate--2-oxoglutarate transaminase [Woeseiaceae bacterium]|nr:4-aminobutyrate--2-oxoglutarate transaminase [Woeseiaceae bacterium]NIP19800.1 4-aminobutyrate--2-oxoglutarate transaminase [Woeseiaceae bacterium]NIS89917.1 4-aminobutyrate--2-oxoglutarate transaminase [Woeseiaceae bacterium]
MTTNKELLEIRGSETPRGVGILTGVFADKARNAEIWDVEGNRYIDLATGIAVVATGHNHPRVVAAVKAQLDRFTHTCFQVTPYDVYVRLAERLNKAAPGPTRKKTIFVNTGAEAVENSVKIARKHTGRSGIIAFSGAFHGRTMMGMALTGKVVPYKAGFGPFPAEVFHVPFPIEYHGVSVADALNALQTLFKSDVEPSRIAAMIVEPVQGEGGFYPAPAEFLQALREQCDRHGIVLIIDEVQTGFGRTGTLFACEQAGVEPDLMPVAKSIAGGFPLAGVIGKADIMDAVDPGGLGSTFGGSPIGCAAGLAVLDVIAEEDLCGKAKAIGRQIEEWAEQLQAETNCIGHIRITGAMSAIEFVRDGDPDSPDADLTMAVAADALTQGVLLLTCGVRGNVIRFLPPLTIEPEVLAEALEVTGNTIRKLAKDLRKAS